MRRRKTGTMQWTQNCARECGMQCNGMRRVLRECHVDVGGDNALVAAAVFNICTHPDDTDNRAECLKLLLQANANVNARDIKGDSALIGAVRSANVKCLKLLLEANAGVNVPGEDGWTALMWASDESHVECLRLLLASRADVNVSSVDGFSCLMWASWYGHAECVQLLLDSKADVDVKSEDNQTALIFAARDGRVECLALLLEHKANVNHSDGVDGSALRSCCYGYKIPLYCKPLIQFVLLWCGAEGEEGKDVLAENKIRITAYHTELKHVLEKIVVVDTRLYLEEHGLYHEPLERVMEYCGLELMLENDPNRDVDDPIPQLLRGRKRASSALYWYRAIDTYTK